MQAISDAQFVAPLVQAGDLFILRHRKKSDNYHINIVSNLNASDDALSPKTYFYVFDYQTRDRDYPQVSTRFIDHFQIVVHGKITS